MKNRNLWKRFAIAQLALIMSVVVFVFGFHLGWTDITALAKNIASAGQLKAPPGTAVVIVDAKNLVKPVLYEDIYPAPKKGERGVAISVDDIYPWGKGRADQTSYCLQEFETFVVSARNKAWLFKHVQEELNMGHGQLQNPAAQNLPLISVPAKDSPVEEAAMTQVYGNPYIQRFFSVVEEKKKAEKLMLERLKTLDESVDVFSVEIAPARSCSPSEPLQMDPL